METETYLQRSAGPALAGITNTPGFVPIIDLSASGNDPAGRRAVADSIGRACRSSGFFAIVGHGVPDETIANIYDATKRFFALPREQKLALLSDPSDPLMRGYGREGSLSASNSDAAVGRERARPDLSETFTINRLGFDQSASLPESADPYLKAPNKWPQLTGFLRAYREYYAAMESLAGSLMSLFALALGLPESWFEDKIDNHMTNLTANYYPPQETPPPAGQLRKGQHSDWGSLTILYQDGVPGLQVRDRVGEWLDVPAVPGSFVINIGDLMAIWTNDRWVSTIHRVVNPEPEFSRIARYSIPFFHQPNYDSPIACIPTCTDEQNLPRHQPVFSGEYIMEKFHRAYGL